VDDLIEGLVHSPIHDPHPSLVQLLQEQGPLHIDDARCQRHVWAWFKPPGFKANSIGTDDQELVAARPESE
jgi:hypothetical protein